MPSWHRMSSTFRVAWGRGEGGTDVATVGELDRVLDGINVRPGGLPYSVGILIPDGSDDPVLLEIGVGHPERSFAFYSSGEDDAAWAYQPDLAPVEGIVVDHGGQATDVWPQRSRVTVAAAREAARRVVASGGHRPDNLSWDDESQ